MIQKARSRQGTPAHGIVKRIEFSHEHPGTARIEVHHHPEGGDKRKQGQAKGLTSHDLPMVSHVHVHENEAAGVKLGQKVHLRIHDGEYGEGSSDEFSE
jgi:hypothetical protein